MEVKLAHSVCFNNENNFFTFDGGLVTKLCLILVTPWNGARQAPLSMGFSRQEYWSGLPFPSSGDLPDPGIEPVSPVLAGRFFTTKLPGKPYIYVHTHTHNHCAVHLKLTRHFVLVHYISIKEKRQFLQNSTCKGKSANSSNHYRLKLRRFH